MFDSFHKNLQVLLLRTVTAETFQNMIFFSFLVLFWFSREISILQSHLLSIFCFPLSSLTNPLTFKSLFGRSRWRGKCSNPRYLCNLWEPSHRFGVKAKYMPKENTESWNLSVSVASVCFALFCFVSYNSHCVALT